MNPAILAAATASHAWAQQSPQWGGTQLSGAGFFWLGLFNVIMLVAFLAIAAQRRDHRGDPSRAERAVGFGTAGSPSGIEEPGEAAGPVATPVRSSALPSAAAIPAAAGPARCRDGSVTATPAVRASDAERDETAGTLSRAIGVGCLDVEEGVERIDAVYHAHFRHQLAALVDDLPSELRRPPARPAGRFYRDLRDFAGLALIAAILLQVVVGAWEMWPVAAAALLPFAFRHEAGDRSLRP